MKREVIQDFLNLPGIAGIALMDGRSRPYFCGVDQSLNFQQKEALAQGILQVVETIPDGFEAFEFQFTGHKVHIYKLDRGIILLVLTRRELVHADYLKTIKSLKAVLQEDISNAIATFRLIAGDLTLTGLNAVKPSVGASNRADFRGTTTKPRIQTVSGETSFDQLVSPKPPQPNKQQVNEPGATGLNPAIHSSNETTLKDLIVVLNHLSNFTTHYLGTYVIANYWKTTRPQSAWLDYFQVDRLAQLSFNGPDPQSLHKSLSPQEQQWVREWVAAFIKRCSQIIRDFPTIVEQKGLNKEQKTLLLG